MVHLLKSRTLLAQELLAESVLYFGCRNPRLIIKTHLKNECQRDTTELTLWHAHFRRLAVSIKEHALQAHPFREIPRQGRKQHARGISEALQDLE